MKQLRFVHGRHIVRLLSHLNALADEPVSRAPSEVSLLNVSASTHDNDLDMFKLQLTPRVVHYAVPPSPLVRFRLTVIDDAQGHQFMIVVAEGVDFDNRVITVGTILEELLAEGNNGLMTMRFLAGKFVNPVVSKETGKLFLV